MRHCDNCDFSKNIESIGPLKIAPIRGLKGALSDLDPKLNRRNPQKELHVQGNKRSNLISLKDLFLNSDILSYDDNFDVIAKATKKDTPGEQQDDLTRVILSKKINIPSTLVPDTAYRRGVIISLPKGKAMLKCIVSKNDTEVSHIQTSDVSKEQAPLKEKEKDLSVSNAFSPANSPQVTSQPASEKLSNGISNMPQAQTPSIIESSPPAAAVITPKSTDDIEPSQHFDDVEPKIDNERINRLRDGFMKILDKDMMVSLYKMAVKDIMSELHHEKNGKRKNEILKSKLKDIELQRRSLETKFPGIIEKLVSVNKPSFSNLYPRTIKKYVKRSKRLPRNLKKAAKRSNLIQVSFKPQTGNKLIKLQLEKMQFTNDTRRVELVDTDRLKHPSMFKGYHKMKLRRRNATKNVSAFSFYGDLDPSKLIENGNSMCLDPLCEKQKQFLNHAGQYFESLDNLALAPYKKFMNGRDRDMLSNEAVPKIFKLPYGESITIEGIKRSDTDSKAFISVKRQSIIDSHFNPDHNEQPNTIVELFGKLPRVPLKITLNPKGPLAKLKRPIEIDLKPPGKGEPASRMIATANDPKVQVHIANKIFKEEPLDPKQEEKLQSVYADIKKRSIPGKTRHVYLTPNKVVQNGDSRMRIVLSLPKELSHLVSHHNHPTVRNLKASYPPIESTVHKQSSPILSFQPPVEKVEHVKQVDHLSEDEAKLQSDKAIQIAQYAKTLQLLQDQTKAAVERYREIQEKTAALQDHHPTSYGFSPHFHPTIAEDHTDPYADIGKRRSKGYSKHIETIKKTPVDPYADVGASIPQISKRTFSKRNSTNSTVTFSPNKKLGINSNNSNYLKDLGKRSVDSNNNSSSEQDDAAKRYEEMAKDPYATLGSALPYIEMKRNNISKNQKLGEVYSKENIPNGVGAISLVPLAPKKIPSESTSSLLGKISLNQVPADDLAKSSINAELTMLTAFPHFKEALAKINPETKKRLFLLKPFRFLSKFDTKENATVQAPVVEKDPFADIGSKRSQRIYKRSDDYDPYADLGTSIGLSQNESLMKASSNDTSEENQNNKTTDGEKSNKGEDSKTLLDKNEKANENVEAIQKVVPPVKVKSEKNSKLEELQNHTPPVDDKVEMSLVASDKEVQIKKFDKDHTPESKSSVTEHHKELEDSSSLQEKTSENFDPYADLGASSYESQIPNPLNSTALAENNQQSNSSSIDSSSPDLKEMLSEKSNDEKSNNEKTNNEKSINEKAPNEKTFNEKSSGEKFLNEKLFTEKSPNEKSSNEKFSNEKLSIEKSPNEKNSNEKSSNEKSLNEKISNEKSSSEISSEKLSNEKLANEKLANEKLSNDRAANEKLPNEKSSNEKLSAEKLTGERLEKLIESEKQKLESLKLEKAEKELPKLVNHKLMSQSDALSAAKMLNKKPAIAEKLIEKLVLPIKSNPTTFVSKLKNEHDRLNAKLKLNEATVSDNENNDVNEKSNEASSDKDFSAEKDLATIERLEKDIAAEKIKAEAEQFSDKSVLQKNVGKEIQGPYTDLGGSAKKKTVEKSRDIFTENFRNLQLPENTISSHRKAKERTIPAAEKSEITKHSNTLEFMQNRLRYDKKAIKSRLISLFLKAQERLHALHNESHPIDLERNADRIFDKLKADKKHTTKNCIIANPEEAMKIIKNSAEQRVNNITEKINNKSVNNKTLPKNPYLFIGTAAAKRSRLPLCSIKSAKENEEMEEGLLQVPASEQQSVTISSVKNHMNTSQHVKEYQLKPIARDPYSEMGSAVDKKKFMKEQSSNDDDELPKGESMSSLDDKKKFIKDPSKVEDAYRDLGTVSIKSDIDDSSNGSMTGPKLTIMRDTINSAYNTHYRKPITSIKSD